jgi:hypothetical protein
MKIEWQPELSPVLCILQQNAFLNQYFPSRYVNDQSSQWNPGAVRIKLFVVVLLLFIYLALFLFFVLWY